MNRSLAIVLAIILFLLGGLSGYAATRTFGDPIAFQQISSLKQKYPELANRLQNCVSTNQDNSVFCAQSILFDHALQHLSESACEDIQDPTLTERCLQRVQVLRNFQSSSAASFCNDFQEDLCMDLAYVLESKLRSDLSICQYVTDLQILDLCLGVNAPQEEVIEPVQFPVSCAAGDTECQNVLSAFRQVVLAGDPERCATVSSMPDIISTCENETTFYSIYQQGSPELCESLTDIPSSVCMVNVVTALAIDNNNAGLCDDLPEETMRQQCRVTVEGPYPGRFDYLTS